MTVRAILWDVGGPLNTEVTHERLIDSDIQSGFKASGHEIDDASYAAASRWAVDSFAPNAYRAIIWHLSRQDASLAEHIYLEIAARSHARAVFELREGIPELLRELHERGIALGLAANQPLATIATLDKLGIGRYFQHRGVSSTHGFRKPDVRLFLEACADLDVEPSECVMVGDRIDNDVVPANALGMRSVLLRTGRHREQQVRSWDEVPYAEVHDVQSLRQTLLHLLDGSR